MQIKVIRIASALEILLGSAADLRSHRHCHESNVVRRLSFSGGKVITQAQMVHRFLAREQKAQTFRSAVILENYQVVARGGTGKKAVGDGRLKDVFLQAQALDAIQSGHG